MKEYEKRSFPVMLEFEEAPEYADVFTMEEFIEAVRHKSFMNYDGIGRLAKADSDGKIWESNIEIDCYVPWLMAQSPDFTHVCWYNK